MADTENSLKKMALVLDRLTQKVEEMERRLADLEKKAGVSNSSKNFLGALGGVVAAMGLYELLMDKDVKAEELARSLGMDMEEESIDDLLEEFEIDLPELEDEEWMSLDDYLASEEGEEEF